MSGVSEHKVSSRVEVGEVWFGIEAVTVGGVGVAGNGVPGIGALGTGEGANGEVEVAKLEESDCARSGARRARELMSIVSKLVDVFLVRVVLQGEEDV